MDAAVKMWTLPGSGALGTFDMDERFPESSFRKGSLVNHNLL